MGSANAAECVDNVPKSARKVSPVMPVRNLADLKSGRAAIGALMGLDLGDKTIGMALAICGALQCSLNSLLGVNVSQPDFTDDEMALIAAHRQIFNVTLRDRRNEGRSP